MAFSDEQLLSKVKDSDLEAFRLLFEKYQPVIFRHIYFHTKNFDLSHDIVQETFLRVWDRRASLNPRLSLLGYLFRISENILRDYIKHQKVKERVHSILPTSWVKDGDMPDAKVEESLLKERIRQIVLNLPERCREVFLLSRVEEKSHKEIAALLQISEKTVENHIFHALFVLRKELKKEGLM